MSRAPRGAVITLFLPFLKNQAPRIGATVALNYGDAGMRSISVVIPALNESKNIGHVLDQLPEFVTEVILVDGGSNDGTVAVAQAHRANITVIPQSTPGKGAAMVAGMMRSTSDIVVLLDADGSMVPGEIRSMVDALVGGADVSKGSRGLPGGGSMDFTPIRKLGNTILTKVANLLYGVKWTDFAYGYFALWTDVLPVLHLEALLHGAEHPLESNEGQRHRPKRLGHGFEIEALVFCRSARRGLNVVEVPSHEELRRHGTSNLKAFQDGVRVGLSLMLERFRPRGESTLVDRSLRPTS